MIFSSEVSGSIEQGYNPSMSFQPTDRFNMSEKFLSQEVNGETISLDELADARLTNLRAN